MSHRNNARKLLIHKGLERWLRLNLMALGAGLHIVECPLSADQQVVELDDVYEITATVVNSDMLDWWLRGFGDSVSGITRIPLTV